MSSGLASSPRACLRQLSSEVTHEALPHRNFKTGLIPDNLFFYCRPRPTGTAPALGDPPHTAAQNVGQSTTPAQVRIDAAKRQIQGNPKKSQAYNELALAYIRRARETANPDTTPKPKRRLTPA